jgi:hypothetical protein
MRATAVCLSRLFPRHESGKEVVNDVIRISILRSNDIRCAKIVKAERNMKQKTKFFVSIPEAHPIFAAQRQSSER